MKASVQTTLINFFLLPALLVGGQPLWGKDLVHQVQKGDDLAGLSHTYANQLDGRTITQINPQRDEGPLRPGQEILIHKDLKWGWCSYKAKKEDSLLELIRQFSYRNPISLGLGQMTLKKNPTVPKNESIVPGTQVLLPFIYLPKTAVPLEPVEDCYSVLLAHHLMPFVVRGHEASLGPDGGLYQAGLSITEYRAGRRLPVAEPQPMRKLASAENFKPSKFDPHSLVEVSAGWSYDSLKGKSANGSQIVSGMQPGFGIEWQQKWHPIFSSFISTQYQLKSYLAPAREDEQLNNREFSQSQTRFGADFRLSSDTQLRVFAGFFEMAYFYQQSEDVYVMDKDQSFVYGLQGDQSLVEMKPLVLGVTVEGALHQAGSRRFAGGILWGGGFSLEHHFAESLLRGRVIYKSGAFKTHSFDYNQEFMEFLFSYQFKL